MIFATFVLSWFRRMQKVFVRSFTHITIIPDQQSQCIAAIQQTARLIDTCKQAVFAQSAALPDMGSTTAQQPAAAVVLLKQIPHNSDAVFKVTAHGCHLAFCARNPFSSRSLLWSSNSCKHNESAWQTSSGDAIKFRWCIYLYFSKTFCIALFVSY